MVNIGELYLFAIMLMQSGCLLKKTKQKGAIILGPRASQIGTLHQALFLVVPNMKHHHLPACYDNFFFTCSFLWLTDFHFHIPKKRTRQSQEREQQQMVWLDGQSQKFYKKVDCLRHSFFGSCPGSVLGNFGFSRSAQTLVFWAGDA